MKYWQAELEPAPCKMLDATFACWLFASLQQHEIDLACDPKTKMETCAAKRQCPPSHMYIVVFTTPSVCCWKERFTWSCICRRDSCSCSWSVHRLEFAIEILKWKHFEPIRIHYLYHCHHDINIIIVVIQLTGTETPVK